mgnify:CR=1 FL=1
MAHTAQSLAGSTAFITGGSRGIGRAIALGLVGEGVRTVFADIKPETVNNYELGIKSRTELKESQIKANKFWSINEEFQQWKQSA